MLEVPTFIVLWWWKIDNSVENHYTGERVEQPGTIAPNWTAV